MKDKFFVLASMATALGWLVLIMFATGLIGPVGR
jgi:hypothetical protein